MGKSINENIGYQVLYFTKKLNVLNNGRHIWTSRTSIRKLTSLKSILSWNVTDSPLSSDHCVITVSIQSKKSEPQTIITKFNINEAKQHLSTSNEAWKQVTNQNQSQSAEALTKDFYIKTLNFFKISYTSDRTKINTLPSPGEQSFKKK